jgi:DNA repair ATPase RecN
MQSKLPEEIQLPGSLRKDIYSALQGHSHTSRTIATQEIAEVFKRHIAAIMNEHQQLKERCEKMETKLEEIKSIHKKYHDLNGDNPAANHLMNIALEALAHKPEGINEKEGEDDS